ncbi:YwdI family protein [Aquibacillus sp. 3ASR75-11]|uniref:YwdI family protein n=1 Tax=Terrihalobacillus insolitus TaxID=2950438 RepID=A0A9X3WSN3_9BACI|nr:YwdI family protein [Terrihalobacillus insolitus]MDC3425087.1 YwdI family protein [Terrihalobacillus insolitus]
MAISNRAVLKKMQIEIQEALRKEHTEFVREHIRAVRLLCDLVLEEDKTNSENPSKKELDAMIGDSTQPLKQQNNVISDSKTGVPKINAEEANGESIFDF